MRKAWKIYDKVYNDISRHHNSGTTYGKVKVQVDLNHTDLLQDGEHTQIGDIQLQKSGQVMI